MKSLPKYLFTPAVDSLNENEQFQYGFSNIDGVDLNFFDKIFFYNVKGIKVFNRNINRKNSFNIYKKIDFKKYIIYLIKYIFFYIKYFKKLKLNFFKHAPTFIFYDNILQCFPGLYFKIFEFSKEDYIFEILANKYKISYIYNLHTIKIIEYNHLKYLKYSKNLVLFICPTLYHYKSLKLVIDSNRLYLSKYYGYKRVKKRPNLNFKKNNKYLILLNGSIFDKKLIKIAKFSFNGDFFLKPHPFHLIKKQSIPLLTDKDKNFAGIIYNNTSSVIRLEYINVPKYFIKVNLSDKDLLEEVNYKLWNGKEYIGDELLKKQKEYILSNFYNKSSNINLMDVLNENINIK